MDYWLDIADLVEKMPFDDRTRIRNALFDSSMSSFTRGCEETVKRIIADIEERKNA